jgi:hypothetical protein
MLDFSKPIQLYWSQTKRQLPFQDWVCEWESHVHAKPPREGIFLIKSRHFLDARQTAKKVLRDRLVLCRAFTFKIRPPTSLEQSQLTLAPTGAVLEVDNFADRSSADSTSKT